MKKSLIQAYLKLMVLTLVWHFPSEGTRYTHKIGLLRLTTTIEHNEVVYFPEDFLLPFGSLINYN